MKANTPIQDVVDVHVTSSSNVVDAFSQYPLLMGERRYTLELTELVAPVPGSALPPTEFFVDENGNVKDFFLRVRRRRVVADTTPVFHDDSSLGSLTYDVDGELVPIFPDNSYYTFYKSARRRITTVGGLIYHLQRFFDDLINRYVGIGIVAASHGGGDNVDVTEQLANNFVSVSLTPSGTMQLLLSPLFTKHFFLHIPKFAQKLLGLEASGEVIGFREENTGIITTGLNGISAVVGDSRYLNAGGVSQSVEIESSHSLFKFFDSRVRLEVETQMGVPITNVWSTSNTQQISHVIATFPIESKHTVKILCDAFGRTLSQVETFEDLRETAISWRRAEQKVSERFLLNNSQYFHNIRVELFLVRRVWSEDKFLFKREKVQLGDSEFWTAKLRFRSIK